MWPPLRMSWRIVVALTIVGFAAQGGAILLHEGSYPRWLLVVAPVVWGLFCGGVLIRLAWLKRIERRAASEHSDREAERGAGD